MPQPAWLISGPPGCGKSTFIYEEARRRGLRLLHWNARVDRSLRDGRDRLHIQVRSREASLLWIEGVEDLNQEAQAFLRRILETATPQVLCVLESTEPWRISAPVLSRCIFKEIEHRKNIQDSIPDGSREIPESSAVLELWEGGKDPVTILKNLLPTIDNATAFEAWRRWGSGASPWLVLSWVLLKKEMSECV